MTNPIRPGEIPHELTLGALAARQSEHAMALHRHQFGSDPLTDAERAGHALGELAYGTALAQRARHGWHAVACEALDAGADHDRVAAAMGMTAGQLRIELRSWADGQRRIGRMDADRHAQVLRLAGGEPR